MVDDYQGSRGRRRQTFRNAFRTVTELDIEQGIDPLSSSTTLRVCWSNVPETLSRWDYGAAPLRFRRQADGEDR